MASGDVKVALPLTSELSLEALPQPLLEIAADGTMQLDGTAIAEGELAAATLDDPVLHVLADRETNAITVLEALEREKLIAVALLLVPIHREDESGS